ncbi:MAG: translesion error-prone DNA polymerase V autoproteolytic subunit [Bacteroidetes bacterium]|jgi:DNA polymerase V|nr:MAG: translesion error-prone DNA polymerase V autoproteolytic subunit [Bacteroidota bacterium]
MEEDFFGASYKGSRQFTQQQVRTANATGFGAAADDYMERGVDLNEQLIMNKPATFFFRMKGDAMQDAGISEGDVLIVDRSLKATSGKIVVGALDGELLIRRLLKTFNKTFLQPENKRYPIIEVTEFMQYVPWGVVTCVIHIVEPVLAAFANKTRVDKPIP